MNAMSITAVAVLVTPGIGILNLLADADSSNGVYAKGCRAPCRSGYINIKRRPVEGSLAIECRPLRPERTYRQAGRTKDTLMSAERFNSLQTLCRRLGVCVTLLAAAVPVIVQASPSSPSALEKQAAAQVKLPADVDIYASVAVGQNETCLVGARTDPNGMNERPVVYLMTSGRGFAWHAMLPMSTDYYQARVTHCVASGQVLYVLEQMDTDSTQSTSQTLLKLVVLKRKNGTVVASRNLDVPGVSAAYTAWVDKGNEHFCLAGDHLVIRGQYDLMSERDNPTSKKPTAFVMDVPSNPRSDGGAP